MSYNTHHGRILFESFSDITTPEFLSIPNWKITKIQEGGAMGIWDKSEVLFSDALSIHEDAKSLKMDLIYLEMSDVWGKNSHCKRMQVGCLMVKNKSIISDGYNGSPSGFPNVCEDSDMITLPYVLHAEANAITKLAKSTQSSDGSTLYVTLSPCFECSKLIIQSGIKRVVFSQVYRNPGSIPFLVEAGVEVVRISNVKNIFVK